MPVGELLGMSTSNKIAAALHAARLAKKAKGGKFTLENLSEITGISVSQLSRFESGKRRPRAEELVQIAAALGTTAIELLGGVPATELAGANSPKLKELLKIVSRVQMAKPEKQAEIISVVGATVEAMLKAS